MNDHILHWAEYRQGQRWRNKMTVNSQTSTLELYGKWGYYTYIKTMNTNIAVMNQYMARMSNDMTLMNRSMGAMRYDINKFAKPENLMIPLGLIYLNLQI